MVHSVKGQYKKSPLEIRTDSLVAELHKRRVDSICVYRSYCVGCRGSRITEDSSCSSKGDFTPTYVLWKQHSKTYLTYLDNCSIISPVVVYKDMFWSYLSVNWSEINKGTIKDFTTIDSDSGEAEVIHRNHGDNYSFDFIIGKDTISQYYDHFALIKRTIFFHKKTKNIYYKQNRKSPIRKIQLQIDHAIVEARKRH
ncbi:hypothetical protein [Hymenobacter qilianensis]|uniref:Uncharacterized protein n=1 Tax=Hymenobacter qilianensis TaxID=1385715 RepID=A0A7H0GVK8_9BACT|nr:hypothetical protein [Hymenobacter qilianensis]QNP52324.1 hypothetical protein H9L05_00460 [Hymenobacter qilianensis]